MSATLVAARPVWQPVEVTRPSARVFRGCLAVFVAVAVARIQDVVPGLAHMYPVKLLMFPLLIATVAAIPRWQLLTAMRTTPAKCLAVITLLAVLSIPLSIWPTNSATFFVSGLIPALALFVVAGTGFADRSTARLCIQTLVLCAGVDAAYLVSGLAPTIEGRAYLGLSLHPNESAAFFVSTLPFAIMLASERGLNRWLGVAVALLLVAGVAKTGSRGGLVGGLLVALLMAIQAVQEQRWGYVLAICAFLGAFSLTANEAIAARFQTILTVQTDYNLTQQEGRIEVWKRGMRYMVTHPLVGVGLAGFETADGTLGGKVNEGYGIRYTAAHNSFVQIGAELGVFGLLAFVTALFSAAVCCRRAKRLATRHRADNPELAGKEANLASAAFRALLAIAVTGFFMSFAYNPITLFIIAACVGVYAGSARVWRSVVR